MDKLDLIVAVADQSGIDPDQIDIVILDQDTPCEIIEDAWHHGATIYEAEPKIARQDLMRLAMICHDYEIMRRKLGLPERAIRRMIERWSD